MQTVTIQNNEKGAVIRVLGVQADITHLKTDNTPAGLSFLGLENEPSFWNVPVKGLIQIPAKPVFSKREQEILKLVLEGKSSVAIAKRLHISKHTVDSHRKKILVKSGCSSLAELGAKAIQNGWL